MNSDNFKINISITFNENWFDILRQYTDNNLSPLVVTFLTIMYPFFGYMIGFVWEVPERMNRHNPLSEAKRSRLLPSRLIVPSNQSNVESDGYSSFYWEGEGIIIMFHSLVRKYHSDNIFTYVYSLDCVPNLQYLYK